MKSNLMPEVWFDFIERHPLWWASRDGRAFAKRSLMKLDVEAKESAFIQELLRVEARGTSNMKIPENLPVEYDDAEAQNAFANVFRDRLHMLRIPV